MEINEATRVMGAQDAPPIDRTMVAGAPIAPPAGATQMGVTVTCPVCRSSNSGMEAYCGECGFLLTSAPGAEESAPEETTGPQLELVENTSGRRFKLKNGPNTVGRENCDILLMEGTVSRRHAQVTVENGAVTVTDFGSTNGTKVNGSALSANQPVTLTAGGTVQFGNAALTFAGPASAAPAAPADVTVVVEAPPSAVQDQATGAEPDSSIVDSATAAEPAAEPGAPPTGIAVLRPTEGAGAPIDVLNGTFTIGRRSGNDIVIPDDPYISGAHALLQSDDSGCYLTDVGSTNGTTVNGVRLEANARQLLLEGDEVTLGQTTYRFEPIQAVEPPQEEEQEAAPFAEDLAATEQSGEDPEEVSG